ncbi:MAG: hypothetical protein WCA23_05435 [Stellaceae bacterium]
MGLVVRFATRSPIAPNNLVPSPLPEIEALIEEYQLLKRIYRQRSGEDETAVIGELGEAIAAVDVFADIPVLTAKALAGGIKHHQSIVEEYHATREPWRWMHLVCGAQAAAISFGKNMAVYEEYLELLHAA